MTAGTVVQTRKHPKSDQARTYPIGLNVGFTLSTSLFPATLLNFQFAFLFIPQKQNP
jgi:hypothetical protein